MRKKKKKKQRLCEICGAPLSRYNYDKVCFHHPEHKNYKIIGEPHHHKPPTGAGHPTPQLNRTIIEYYGDIFGDDRGR